MTGPSHPPAGPRALPTSHGAYHPLRTALEGWMTQADRVVAELPGHGRRGSRVLDGVQGLRARLGSDGGVNLQARAESEAPWGPVPASFPEGIVHALASEFRDLRAPEAALANCLALALRRHAEFTAEARLPRAVVQELLAQPAAHDAMILPDGSPFVIEPQPLAAVLKPSDANPSQLRILLLRPDGAPAADACHVAGHSPALYLHAGRAWWGPPPAPPGYLPAVALRDPDVLQRLRALGVTLTTDLETRFRRVKLRPELHCGPSKDGTSPRIRLLAVAEDPPCAQAWCGSRGWRWLPDRAPPPPRPGEPVLEFDLTDADRVASALGKPAAGPTGGDGTWPYPETSTEAGMFAARIAMLPRSLALEVPPELAGFFRPPLRAHLAVDIVPTSADRDWFDLKVAVGTNDTTLTPAEIALLRAAQGRWVHLPRSGWRRLEPGLGPDDGETPAALERLGIPVEGVLSTAGSATHRVHACQIATETAVLAGDDAGLAEELLLRFPTAAGVPPTPLPAGLQATLRPYQLEGFRFLARLSGLGGGGLLADDMGLGKTVQTLAWLLHLAAKEGAHAFRALVICPKSVVPGWIAETKRFAPGLQAGAFEPANVTAPPAGLLVANYAQLRLHAARLREGAWNAVVLDEGQFIKNPQSQVAAAARALPGRHRLVLTGTPVQNRLDDLWSLFAFVQPGLLGPLAAFRRSFTATDPAALVRLQRRVQPFLLRRTKDQVAPDLPTRREIELKVELAPRQRQLYDAELTLARAKLKGVRTEKEFDEARFSLLSSLLRLRQICCHPGLVDPAYAHLPSAKLEALLVRLKALRDEGRQVLVFSQFVSMLDLIALQLEEAGISHLMLTGRTQGRGELVARFQQDPTRTVFLLSIKAAGFGLNLTAATHAILYDPWWNPAVEAQAIDRTHRIGQTRPVTACRLLATGTVEDKIRDLHREKASLAAAVVDGKGLDLETLRHVLG